MNLIRKFGNWLWNSKERLVLASMVIILGYRVYMVVSPQELGDDSVFFNPPGNSISIADIPGLEPPPTTPPPPPIMDWRPLWRDPLWIWNPQRSRVTDSNVEDDPVEIELLNIQESGGKLSARIRVGRSRKWYQEGDKFFAFSLLRIDKDTNCCDVFSDARNKPIEICIKEE